MRVTVSQLKGVIRAPVKSRPDPDTKIGRLYDAFRAAPARPIRYKSEFGNKSVAEALRNYGLDVRPYGPGVWWLVGEWRDNVYVDHLAARVS